MADELPDETIAGTSHGAAADETEILPDPTEAAPELAWSHEEPATEMLSRPWRSAWVIAGVGVACAVVIALVVVGIGIAAHHDRTPPTTTQAAPMSTPTTKPKPPVDDDEYVAIAISPASIQGPFHSGGFGTAGSQDRADQIALSECRARSGHDDCLLVNSGMYHGCIAYAVDGSQKTWASGSGADPSDAIANATSRLGLPASGSGVQCSDPPGILKAPPTPSTPQAVAPLPPPAPATVTVQAAPPAPTAAPAPRDADRIFHEGVAGIPGMHIVNWDVAEAGARSICGGFTKGMTRAQIVDEVQRNDPTFTPAQTSGMVNVALAAYCPQYEGN